MDPIEFAQKRLSWLPAGLLAFIEQRLTRIPAVQRRLESEYDDLLAGLEGDLQPYRGRFTAYDRLPETGLGRQAILADLEAMQETERPRWESGFASGAVYHGDPEHIDFLNRAYALHSQSNPLHSDLFPSAAKFEAEIVAMTARMLGAEVIGGEAGFASGEAGIVGTVTSGGTEGILLAMKTYRDRARRERGITRPEIVVPVTAHAAFEKAAQYFNLKLVRVPVDEHYRADIDKTRRAINRRTVVVVGSAPSFPHGAVDPIPELSELARERGIGFHTDACLGGFVLPWAKELGFNAPDFDFRLPGVTSISADTHKYGYAAKGTSVILYRGAALRRWQYYAAADWPGGLYFSPTFAGSRPGALSAAAWAAMLSLGAEGYRAAARRILQTGAFLREQVAQVPHLRVLGDPLWVIAFASDDLDIYRVMDEMRHHGWSLNGLHRPPAVHLAVTLRHTQPGVAERFISDLRLSVEAVAAAPKTEGGMAPIYGIASTMPLRGLVTDLLKRYLDLLYRV